MQNARSGAGAHDRLAGGCDRGDHTRTPFNIQDCLATARRHCWSAERLGAVLALRFSQPHCLLLTTGAFYALAPEDRARFIEAASLDFYSDDAGEREAERQRRQWSQWCARTWRARP